MRQHVLLKVSAPVAAISNVIAVPQLHCSCSSNPVPLGALSVSLDQEQVENMKSAVIGKVAFVIPDLTQSLVRA